MSNTDSISGQLIKTASRGFDLLDTDARAEVARFIESRQHQNGLFTGRDDKPDIYYSLFGTWLCEAAGLSRLLDKTRMFIRSHDSGQFIRSDTDMVALMLLKQKLEDAHPPGLLKTAGIMGKTGSNISFAYKVAFLSLLFGKHPGKRILIRSIFRIMRPLSFLTPDPPGSFYAAIILARLSVGLKAQREAGKLQSYYEAGKGFKAFHDTCTADLLSTGISLFALYNAGVNMSPFAAGCLAQIEDNYRSGAFIAGEGDETRDLEYTFYGLLAAGSLE